MELNIKSIQKMRYITTSLLFLKMFYAISFSIMYSTLVLYMTDQLKFQSVTATNLMASFLAYTAVLRVAAGFLGSCYFGHHFILMVGLITMIVGCVFITIPNANALYWGIAAFTIGSGFIVSVQCILTELFSQNNKQRQTAFLMNYSAMNIGYLIGFTLSGFLQLQNNYLLLFVLSSIGAALTLVIVVFSWPSLRDASLNTEVNSSHGINSNSPSMAFIKKLSNHLQGLIVIGLFLLALRWLLENTNTSNNLIVITALCMLCMIGFLAIKQPTIEAKHKLFAYLILAIISLVFWTLSSVSPMALT